MFKAEKYCLAAISIGLFACPALAESVSLTEMGTPLSELSIDHEKTLAFSAGTRQNPKLYLAQPKEGLAHAYVVATPESGVCVSGYLIEKGLTPDLDIHSEIASAAQGFAKLIPAEISPFYIHKDLAPAGEFTKENINQILDLTGSASLMAISMKKSEVIMATVDVITANETLTISSSVVFENFFSCSKELPQIQS